MASVVAVSCVTQAPRRTRDTAGVRERMTHASLPVGAKTPLRPAAALHGVRRAISGARVVQRAKFVKVCAGLAPPESASSKNAPPGAPPPSGDAPVDWTTTGPAFFFPAVGGLLFGYDIGVTSAALVSLTSGGDLGALSPLESGLVVSLSLAGALTGSLAALTKGDDIGRRAELQLSACLYAAGAALMAGAPDLSVLLLGRFVYGAGIGFAMHAAPIYIAETAPAAVRGTLISCKEAFIVGGILLGYVSGAQFIGDDGGWRSMLGAAGAVALAFGAGATLIPESPRWLLQRNKQGDREAAEQALARLSGSALSPEGVSAEVSRLAASAATSRAGATAGGGAAALLAPKNRRALYAGMSLMLFQQITGQPSVLYYATDIFQRAGFASAAEATQADVILGTFKLLMTGVAVLVVDKLGRRPLLLTGVGALTAALLALGTLTIGGEDSNPYGCAAALLIYVGAYQLSFGPIAWLMVGEVFPADVRTYAVGAATITNFGSNFLVSLVLPLLQTNLGQSGTYFFFSVLGIVSVTSIYLTIPETKGKTLEQIEEELSGSK